MFEQKAICVFYLHLIHQLPFAAPGKMMLISRLSWRVWFVTVWRLWFRYSQAKIGRGFSEPHIYLHKKMHVCTQIPPVLESMLLLHHTQLKSQLKAIMGFPQQQPQGEQLHGLYTLRAHTCPLCCHPKELWPIHKLYDHNYWSKLKCNNNTNSEDCDNIKKEKKFEWFLLVEPSGTLHPERY